MTQKRGGQVRSIQALEFMSLPFFSAAEMDL